MAVWVQESRHFYAGATTWHSWLALPWNFYLDLAVGRYGSYTAGPLLLAFAVVVAGFRAWRPPQMLVLAVCLVEWTAWSFTSQVARYIMPMFAAWFALGGAVAGGNPRMRKSLAIVALFWATLSLVLGANHRCNLDQDYGLGAYTFGRLNAGDMQSARGFGKKEMAGLPPGKLLLWGDIPPLGTGRRWVGASGFNHPLVKTWAGASTDLRRLRVKARQAGVRGVAYSAKAAGLHASRGPGYPLTAREERLVREWVSSLRRAGGNSRFVFYSVPPGR
jgi:hypothetical protein